MVKLSDAYANAAAQGAQLLEGLAREYEAADARASGLRELRERFRGLVSDGVLTKDEANELEALLKQSGLDPREALRIVESLAQATADGSLDVEHGRGASLKDLINGAIDTGLADLDDADDARSLRVQIALSDFHRNEEMASRLEKMGFDADMAVIRNIIG